METSFIFSSDNIEIKNEGENFFVEGYISTSDLDLVNDIVTKSCLLDMAEQMKKRTIKFDVEHESFRGKSNLDREANKTIIPVAKVDDFLMDKKGLKVRAMLNKYTPRFDEVKGSIKEGFLDAFSIAYVPVKSVVQEKNGEQVRLLDKINLLNVAFTGNPVNTESKMTNVFAKSLEFLKDQEDNHLSDNKIKLQEVKDMEEEKEKLEAQKKAEEEAKAEEEKEKEEAEVKAKEEAEKKAEEDAEKEKEDVEKEEAKEEVKSLKEEVNSMKKEMIEIKDLLKKPILKSKISQQDKSENFVEDKSQNPLDLI